MGKQTIIAVIRGIDSEGCISGVSYYGEASCSLEIESYELNNDIYTLRLFNGNAVIIHAVNCTIIRKKDSE